MLKMVLVKRRCLSCKKYFKTTKTLYYCKDCYAKHKKIKIKNDYEVAYEDG